MRTRIGVATLATVALLLAGCTTRIVTAGPTADTVTVAGTGSALSAPDRATIRFGVSKSNADPQAAMSAASAASNKVTAALKKAGIADKDLQTGSVRLEPQHTYPAGGPPKLTGFQAGFDVSAKTRDLGKVGAIIAAGTKAGATTVSGVTFDLDETNPARYEASANAIKDARGHAEAMAKAAGRSLGSVITIGTPQATGGTAYRRLPYDAAMINYGLGAVPNIQPGQLTAGDTVEVTFALK